MSSVKSGNIWVSGINRTRQTDTSSHFDARGCGRANKSCPVGSWNFKMGYCFLNTDKQICARALPKSCPMINGGPGQAQFDRINSNQIRCKYLTGDFQWEENVDEFINTFGSDTPDLNEHILPYFCKFPQNIKTDKCLAFCDNQWGSNPNCSTAVRNHCAVADNALNDDFCYDQCTQPQSGTRPSWCDTKMMSVCKLVSPITTPAGMVAEQYYSRIASGGIRGKYLMVLIILGILFAIKKWFLK